MDTLIGLSRKTFRVIQFSNEFGPTENMELVVLPSQSNNEQSTFSLTEVGNFQHVENLSSFFKSVETSSLARKSNKVLLFKLKIEKILFKPSVAELDELAELFANNSIVILLSTKDGKNFFLYWKSKEIRNFLMLKIYNECDFMNDLRLFEFLAKFLSDGLRHGHLGLHSALPINSTTNAFELHLLADHRNYNLLLIAAEQGNQFVVNFMLDGGFNTESYDTNAQTLAYNNKHFEILLSLLKSNLPYPESIKMNECPNDIIEFYEVTQSLNEAMLLGNSSKVLEILSLNPEMLHFYNLSNESAPVFALRNKLWDMYALLISKDIKFGRQENFSEIKDKLKDSERKQLREIHYKESKYLPDNHMHVLISNVRLAPSTSEPKQKYEIIQKAFDILNENPFIQIILMIIAASRNFRIVFDFNRDSVEVIDPTADASTKGLFYLSGRIYIGAKQLLKTDTKYETFGTLAHELCHYAVNLVYNNLGKPYLRIDNDTATKFEEISQKCLENYNNEEIMKPVYECYPSHMQHAELIVRVPHLIMQYLQNPEKVEELRRLFSDLFDFFENKVVKELKEALPIVEAKAEVEAFNNKKRIRNLILTLIVVGILAIVGIISGVFISRSMFKDPNYKFNGMSIDDQKKVMEAPVSYKNIDLKFRDLFPDNSVVYPMLESHLISNMLKQEPLNFSSFHMRNLESLVTHNWKNMTSMLREKVLASSLNFQGQILNFEELNKSYPKVLDHLSSDQIIDILDGKIISVHKMMKEESFYVERKFLDENINAIFFEFMEYVKGDELNGCFSSNLTGTSKTFEDFYKEFTNQSIPSQINRFNQIKQDEIFKKCKTSQFWIKSEIKLGKHNYMYKVTDQLSLHTSMHLKFEQILEIANKFKMFILSAVAGSGKSQTFMQFATRIKEKYPMRWITYIDLKDYKNVDLNVTNLQDVQELLGRFFNLSSKIDFEKAIFDALFESGNVILLWNGFDEIAPTYSNAVKTILNIIKNNSQIIQFICTRPLYSDLLGNSLQAKTYTFLPFEKEEQKNFVKQFFISQNFDEKTKNISGYLEKVEKIVISTSPEVGFDTPLMLLMIAELILNDADIYESENLYEIYRKFAEKKFEIWMENEFAKSFLKTILVSDFNMMKLYQSYAIKNEFLRNDKSKIYLFRLTLMNQKIPENLTNDEISRMGILHINDKRNFKFTHKTFSEFFIVQYLIDNIYNAHDEPSDDEAELRIWLFFESITRPDIKRFINAFYKTKNANESNRFDLQIGKVLKTKFKKLLFYNLEQFDINKFIFLLNFFKKDRNVLKTLLQIDENETFYTALFNFAHVEFLREDRLSIKNILKPYLTDDEFKQLINGRNQKGIILFSVYCLRYKQYVGIDSSHDTYKLDDQLLISTDPFYVFESIAKNLTKAELKELLESKIVSESIQLQDGSKHDIFNDKMWNIIEKSFNKFEQKEILENIFPYFGSQNILKFVLRTTSTFHGIFSLIIQLENNKNQF
ncbi:hypothetical protein ACKWTF_006735 [Chironomus riparius]